MGSTRSANAILRDDGDSDDDEAQMYSQAGDTVLVPIQTVPFSA